MIIKTLIILNLILSYLTVDADPPDLYAIGFQELDLSKEAFVFLESEREAEWTTVVTGGLTGVLLRLSESCRNLSLQPVYTRELSTSW